METIGVSLKICQATATLVRGEILHVMVQFHSKRCKIGVRSSLRLLELWNQMSNIDQESKPQKGIDDAS
jgi:hypothetical protein